MGKYPFSSPQDFPWKKTVTYKVNKKIKGRRIARGGRTTLKG
jgi:hypothetical protein